ncbi:MAG: hypothetical protein HW412_1694, partial [Bacteroidetes bacterium]|nr:hypothetical protein [Bacteroidota bacterium]
MLLICFGNARAEDSEIEKAIKAFNQDYVKGYIQPFSDFFGANMSAGWYHSAAIPQTGFSLSVNVIAMGSVVGDDQKTFTTAAPAGFAQGTFQTPTVFGGQAQPITDPSGFSYRGSDGVLDVPLFPLATLQVHIGSIYGTEAIVRFLPIPEVSGAPKVTSYGFGVRHSISQYLLEFPVDIAASVFYNRISFGDLIDMSSFSFGAQASKSFAVLELYGGMAYESSSMDITYTSTAPGGANVEISLPGANKFRATLRLGLNLAILHLYGDVNFGSVTNFSAGL